MLTGWLCNFVKGEVLIARLLYGKERLRDRSAVI